MLRAQHAGTVLFFAAGSIFHLEHRGACAGVAVGAGVGWQSQGLGTNLGDSTARLSLVAAGTLEKVQQRERSHSQIACVFLNSFIEWHLPFILPLTPVHIAGILSQSHIIIPRSPQATACQWSPWSLDRQLGHMKSYMQRFNAFS